MSDLASLEKPKHKQPRVMSASPFHFRKPTTRCAVVFTPFIRHLNTGTLAFVMFVAFAVLSPTHGNECETKKALAKATKTEVAIDHFSFAPMTFTVPIGATVIGTNNDNVPNLVTGVEDQYRKSPLLNAGQRLSNTFATAGAYSYLCSIHPRITRKLIVN